MEKPILDAKLLEGVRVLILEDEFLIAMDVEQLCRDYGAADVQIRRSLEELGPDPLASIGFDVAVVDMRLGGTSTLDFARGLFEAGIPFVFATGYADLDEFATSFPGVEVVGKPYLGTDLVGALGTALARRRS
ncbi:MAG: response regulator [Mesorhizobium sp.]|nr:response regulator [Mesorhizobium sp.]